MSEILIANGQIHLRNDHISYIMQMLEGGIPMHLYTGARVAAMNPTPLLAHAGIRPGTVFSMQNCTMDRLPQEYPQYGLGDFRQGAVIVRSSDGTAICDLRFVSAEITDGKPALNGLPATFGSSCKTLTVLLRDAVTGLEARMLYTIFDDCDVVTRSVCFTNTGSETLKLERAFSLCLDLPDDRYDLITLNGDWGRERSVNRRHLVPGEMSVGSLRGASSSIASPFIALVRPETTEAQGEVIAAALVYSGNFHAGIQVDSNACTRMLMGIHDQGFCWTLEPGAQFQTPEAVLVWSDHGLDGMSAQFHRICVDHIVRGPFAHAERPILLNNWEATYFNFDEEKLMTIATTAANCGVELFVLDDGWFGHRDDDHTSLGDWYTDLHKLPHGLKHLVDRVHGLGLKFGLWFEPEMVSPDSDLYRAHPDWAIHVKGRTPIEGRNQLTLDMSREDVQEYVYHAVGDTLRANGIDYVKWDMNRSMTNLGSALLPANRQTELTHRYMLGLYRVLERLTQEFPQILFESCASGGCRFDMGMLYYMPQTWCSDNTDAVSRCRIQYGTSMVFPPFSMGAHVSAVPNHQTGRVTPLATRANVAMSGCFGFELDLNKLTAEELDEVKTVIKRVKALRPTLLYGSFHRLLSPFEGNDTAWLTISEDGQEAILMVTRAMSESFKAPILLPLRGLDESASYRVEETGEIYTGSQLLNSGLAVGPLFGDASSVSLVLHRIDQA